jgi:hypothetical protein
MATKGDEGKGDSEARDRGGGRQGVLIRVGGAGIKAAVFGKRAKKVQGENKTAKGRFNKACWLLPA